MLDEYKKNIRKPNPEELRLIKFLVQKASLNMSEGWERSLTVSCLNDGGMGSMKLYMSLPPKEIISTIFVSECSFKDSDGIDVLAHYISIKIMRFVKWIFGKLIFLL